jgi:hypothetical protein
VDDQGHVGLGGPQVDQDSIDITITPVNDAPEVSDQSFAVGEHSPGGIVVGWIVAADADLGDSLTFAVESGDPGGAFTVDAASGAVSVAGHVDLLFEAQDRYQLRVRVTDDSGAADTAVVTVDVTNVDTPPTASGDRYAVDQATTFTVAAGGVLANDADVDGDALTAILLSRPAHGAFSFAADGSFTYTPDPTFIGTDSFTYRPTDGIEAGTEVTVLLEVHPLAQVGDNGPDDSNHKNEQDSRDDEEDEPSGDTSTPLADPPSPDPPSADRLPQRDGQTSAAPAPVTTLWPGPASEPASEETTAVFVADSAGDAALNQTLRVISERDAAADDAPPATDRRNVPTLNTGLLWGQLDTLQEDLLHDVESGEFFQNLVVGTTAASVTGLTVGYVIWLIRGGTLIAGMVSALPAWIAFDPLPVLDSFSLSAPAAAGRQDEEDDDWQALVN